MHAGAQNGFVSGASLIFVSGAVSRLPHFDEWGEFWSLDSDSASAKFRITFR
jgi:hypothetical protein